MPRREFKRAVYAEIVNRATRENDRGLRTVYCEGCNLPTKNWHVDHTIPDGLQIDKSKPLTASDGKLLCAGSKDSCHSRKTCEEDVPAIAKAKRVEAKHLRIATPAQLRGAAMPKSPKAAARAARGHRPALPIRLPPGFVSASEGRSS